MALWICVHQLSTRLLQYMATHAFVLHYLCQSEYTHIYIMSGHQAVEAVFRVVYAICAYTIWVQQNFYVFIWKCGWVYLMVS